MPSRPSGLRFPATSRSEEAEPVDLLILGASARAAAFSALRLGLRPTCADLFADADLASACPLDPDRSVELSRRPGRPSPRRSRRLPGSTPGRSRTGPTWSTGSRSRHPLLGNPGSIAPSRPRPDRAGRGRSGTRAWSLPRSGSTRIGTPGRWFVARQAARLGGWPRDSPVVGRSDRARRPSISRNGSKGSHWSALFVGGTDRGAMPGDHPPVRRPTRESLRLPREPRPLAG